VKIRIRRGLKLNQKGFTLIEVMIGLIILAVGLLGVAGMQITSVKGNYFSKNLTQASYVAMERLEFLRGLSLNEAALSTGSPHSDGTFQDPISGTAFVRSYTVASEGSLRRITYTVTWNDGVNHSVTFVTKRAQ
jgi:type IV pilus assembly protein PilV